MRKYLHLSSPRPAVLAFASAGRLKLQSHEYRQAFWDWNLSGLERAIQLPPWNVRGRTVRTCLKRLGASRELRTGHNGE